ncbi:MAG: HI0074 family nucleotidyltransferase substrate-binding subunit [Candidatus Binatia bacterium]
MDCQSPKSCSKLAFKNSWILDVPAWLAMLVDRNQTSHTYDEALAKAVYSRLRGYLPLFEDLKNNLAA